MKHDHEINYAMTKAEIVDAINEANNCYIKSRPAELSAIIEDDITINGIDLAGSIAIEIIADIDLEGLVADAIAPCITGLPLEFITADESACIAWYKKLEG